MESSTWSPDVFQPSTACCSRSAILAAAKPISERHFSSNSPSFSASCLTSSNRSSTARFVKFLIGDGNSRRCGGLALHFRLGEGQEAVASRTVGGSATPAARKAKLAAGRGADDEAFAVVLDFGLGQRIQIGEDVGPGGSALKEVVAELTSPLSAEC